MHALTRFLQPGCRAFVSAFSTESALLQEALAADPERARDVTFCAVQFPGIDRCDYLSAHPRARIEAHFMSPAVRTGLASGRADLLALDYPGIARHLDEGPPPDVAIAHLTPPDADGWCSAGLGADFLPIAWPRARRRVAHLNPRMPRTRGSFRVHLSELDDQVEADRPLLQWAEPGCGEIESRIGAQVAQLVRDGDTLQFGIGSVPVALAGALAQHRNLRIHGGMVTDALRTLWHAGTLDRDARITSGVVLGGDALHDFVRELPTLWLTDVRHTHDPAAIAKLGAQTRFVAINSAVEVDLFGQVNAERAGGVLQAGAGGLSAFARAAQMAPGGRLLICLPSAARTRRSRDAHAAAGSGDRAAPATVPRIVPALDARGLCTLPRHLADAVVTEHGVAELRDRPLDARAQALIAIAAPEHREALSAAWHDIRRAL